MALRKCGTCLWFNGHVTCDVAMVADRMRSPPRSRNWIPSRNSRRRQSWRNSWKPVYRSRSSPRGGIYQPPHPNKKLHVALGGHTGKARPHGVKDYIQTYSAIKKDSDFKTALYHAHNRLTSQLHSSRHVNSVGCDQLRIRHLCTELELLEPSLFFWLGQKRQQVLASQPVV